MINALVRRREFHDFTFQKAQSDRLLASHVLGRIVRGISRDWQEVYGHPLYFLETFVDPERFRGTCYRAANWQPLGITTGRGKDSQTRQPNRSIKEVLGYPLAADFRERLSSLTDAP